MRISRIRVENFRSLRDFQMEPEDGVNLLVGENNAGKSALLVSMDKALGRGTPIFEIEDFYVTVPSTPVANLPTITIDIEVRPDTDGSFSTNFLTDFVDEIAIDRAGAASLTFRTQALYNPIEDRISVEYYSIRSDGSARSMNPQKRFRLQSYLPFYLVDAFRDTIRDVQSRRGFWGRMINSITLDATTVASIEASVDSINQSILSATPRINEIRDRLREIGIAIPTADPPDDIRINPITVESSAILRNLDVILHTSAAPRGFGLARHGEGTRSVAHLAIFRTFVDLMARDENGNNEATPIIGIEEPEVHLHPHAIRAIGAMLSDPPRQMFFTTHSPDLARSIDLTSVQVLRRDINGTERRLVPKSTAGGPLLDDKDQVKLDRALRSGAIEILFSRATILCEGPSEVHAYSYFASALGIDMDRHGISLVPVDGSYFYHLLRIMADDALQIPWVVSADGDTLPNLARQLVNLGKVTAAEVSTAEASGNIRADILRPHDVITLPNGYNFEEALIRGGAAPEYQAAIVSHIGINALLNFVNSENLSSLTVEDQLVEFMSSKSRRGGKKWKVLFADVVADQITQGGTDPARIPQDIADALQLVEQYSAGTATKVF